MDNLLLPGEETGTWSLQDWRWDPFKMEAEPTERSKPTRSRNQRGPVVCQVDGCGADLTGLKEYHQRYKICEYHLKVSSIIKDAVQQRFCQQCGRFHVLSEFDGVKRSCRARLERHNARRRKKSESHSRRSSSLSPATVAQLPKEESKGTDSVESQYDVDMSQYEVDEMFHASPAMIDPSLTPASMAMDAQETATGMETGKQDALMQLEQMFYESADGEQSQSPSMMMANDAMQLEPRDIPSSEEGDPIAEVFRNFTQSAEARDLWQAMQSSVSRLDSQSSSSVHQGQVLMTPPREVLPGRPVLEPIPIMAPPSGGQFGTQGVIGVACSQPQDMQMATEGHFGAYLGQVRNGGMAFCNPGQAEGDTGDLQGRDMFDERGTAALYDSLLKLTSLSVKVFNCTPANLPAPLRRELLGAVRGGLVPEGYMRPGCVHLTLDVMHAVGREISCQDVVSHLLRPAGDDFWKKTHFLVQLGCSAIIVKDGLVIQEVDAALQQDVFPVASIMKPICILNKAGEKFMVTGQRISGLEDMMHCRLQGRHLRMEYDFDEAEEEKVECTLLEDCPQGTIRVEASHHNVLASDTQAVLAVSDKDIVAEVRQLEHDCVPESALRSFIMDLGMVLEFGDWIEAKFRTEKAHTAERTVTRDYNTEEQDILCVIGEQILAYACDRGWKALVKVLLPVALYSVYLARSRRPACEDKSKLATVDKATAPCAEPPGSDGQVFTDRAVLPASVSQQIKNTNLLWQCTEAFVLANSNLRELLFLSEKSTAPLLGALVIEETMGIWSTMYCGRQDLWTMTDVVPV